MSSVGAQLLLAGRVREAIESLVREAGEASSSNPHDVHHNLAVALRARGEIAEALVHVREAERWAPACAPTLALHGSLSSLAGDRAAARAMFERAVAIDPDHAVSRYYLAIALAADGDRAASIAGLEPLQATEQLPLVVRERIRAQVCDLRNGEGPIALDLCSTPLVAEIVGVRGSIDRPSRSSTSAAGGGRSIDLDEARTVIRRASRVVALTGAGISSASGLSTRKELWQRHDRDGAVSIAKFRDDPLPLWRVIEAFLGANDFAPNAAHAALAHLPNLVAVVTQNVDGLHQAAETPCPTIELHGTLLETRCDRCGARPGLSCADALARGAIPPPCACGGVLRPDVVLFGEWVERERLERATELCAACDVLLVIGTAADVAPAADLALLAAARGAIVIEVKRQPSRLARAIDIRHLAGRAEDVLPLLASVSR